MTPRITTVLAGAAILCALALTPLATGTPAHAAGSATWTPTGSMAAARVDHTATLLPDGKVLVAGGETCVPACNGLASAELYNPSTGTWAPTGNLHSTRSQHTATLLKNGKVLVVGGCIITRGNCTTFLASAELYNPTTGTWSVTGSLHTGRVYHTATLLATGQVLVAGGLNMTGHHLAGAELYDPATGTWSVTGSLHTGRDFHAATRLADGRVLVAGGIGGNPISGFGTLTSTEVYSPSAGTWMAGGDMITPQNLETLTLLRTGRVLSAGGENNSGPIAAAQVYNPRSNAWVATGSLHTGRAFHTATLLPNGQVLVAGGCTLTRTGCGALTSAELYDPHSGVWTATSSMATARVSHTATLLPGGKVLVVGGLGSNGVSLASAEVYG